ncbi:MAG: hypothetical protein F4X53_15950 [Acidimicrobiales bacterium]|nr:hypothetical protein [Acidimicrobiales bacterium]
MSAAPAWPGCSEWHLLLRRCACRRLTRFGPSTDGSADDAEGLQPDRRRGSEDHAQLPVVAMLGDALVFGPLGSVLTAVFGSLGSVLTAVFGSLAGVAALVFGSLVGVAASILGSLRCELAAQRGEACFHVLLGGEARQFGGQEVLGDEIGQRRGRQAGHQVLRGGFIVLLADPSIDAASMLL